MPTNDFAALVRELEEAARETIYASMSQDDRAAQRLAAETELADARAALLAYGAGVERAEYPSDVPDVPRVIWDALNEVDPDWTGSMIEGDVRDSEHAAVAIRQLRTPTAAVIGQCRACRFAITEGDGEMECERMSRVQHIGSLSNGTACATPYEGCSAVLEVTPDFGCVLWEARKDGV